MIKAIPLDTMFSCTDSQRLNVNYSFSPTRDIVSYKLASVSDVSYGNYSTVIFLYL